jgi:hypothetical protein
MALIAADVDAVLKQLVSTLEPYLGDVVFIGGAASALYRRHSKAHLRPSP